MLVAAAGACTTGLAPEPAPPKAVQISREALIGEWALVRVGSRPVSQAMTLGFRPDGVMIGSLRCNSMSGDYEVSPPAIRFPNSVIVTTASCPAGFPDNAKEALLAEQVLHGDPPPASTLSADGRRLYVRGKETLEFVRTRQNTPASDSTGPAPVSSLAGAWRVAAIDGRSLDQLSGLALVGDEDKLWWEPGCAGMVRRYRISGRTLSVGPLRPPPPAGSPPQPVCAIGLPPRLDEVFSALEAATTVTRTAENGILIAGGGRSLTLFSQ